MYHCLEMIHKDPSLDVYNLATQMFPDITSDIFYGDNLAGLKKSNNMMLFRSWVIYPSFDERNSCFERLRFKNQKKQ